MIDLKIIHAAQLDAAKLTRFPWFDEHETTGVRWGNSIAFQVRFPTRTIYSLWHPVVGPKKVTENDLTYQLDMLDKVEYDGVVYESRLERFAPGLLGVYNFDNKDELAACKDELAACKDEWDKLARQRTKLLLGVVFPESKTGFQNYQGSIVVLKGDILTTHDLDELKDNGFTLDPFVGCKVEHDCYGRAGRLVKLKTGKFAVRWKMKCGHCPKLTTVYTMSGCHNGAYCYVCDLNGKYLADLRNQYVLCKTCSEARR
jgi:hypothetical protein